MGTVTTLAVRKPRTPRYIELADQLRDDIARGEFPGGFPTESALCTRFACSRFTVREALRTLSGEGLIERKRGSGTIVQPPSARGGALHQPLSNVEELLQYARDTRFDFARVADSGLPPAIEAAIGIEDGPRWIRFYGVRLDAAGVPLAVTDAFVAERYEYAARSIEPERGAIFSQLQQTTDVKLASVTQDIQAIAATAAHAEALGLVVGDPVLRIIRCYLDADGRAFEISASYHPGVRFAYAMHVEVDG